MSNNLNPIWLFFGSVALRYGGDLLKIAILTINHQERLNPSLIRPGRCIRKASLRRRRSCEGKRFANENREFKLGYLAPESCIKMLECLFPGFN